MTDFYLSTAISCGILNTVETRYRMLRLDRRRQSTVLTCYHAMGFWMLLLITAQFPRSSEWFFCSADLGNCVFSHIGRALHKIQQAGTSCLAKSYDGGIIMCNLCDCLGNLFSCGNDAAESCVDDIETTVVCGNCQCAADTSCDALCNAQTQNSCDCCCGCNCGCNRCGRCGG